MNDTNHRAIIVITIMLVATLEVLDSTIINVALPNMMGSLGANTDQITWVLTSYIVASAIFMPLTGFLVDNLGRKRLLLINIVGFMLSSMFCGIAGNLEIMVIFRLAQGAFGAALIPLSQAILRDTFSKEEQGKAMAIWGIGIMATPIIGPTLGAYITENAGWRWLFYLNIPVCLISFGLAMYFIKDTLRKPRSIDWTGLALMAIGVGSMQYVLDQGNQLGWFSSTEIKLLTLIAFTTMATFLIRGWRKPDNIINLKLFKDPNFSASTLMLGIFSAGIFSIIATQPLMLQTLMNYPVIMSGLVLAPRGVTTVIGMAIAPRLMKRVGNKPIIVMALLFMAFGTFEMSHFNLSASIAVIIWPSLIQGFGMGLFFVPLSTGAFVSLPESATSEAAGLFSYGRMLGTSIGISVMSTIITTQTQVNWNRLGAHIYTSNPSLQHWLALQNLDLHDPTTIARLGQLIHHQANMIAFVDGYWVTAMAFIVMIPLVLLMRKI